MGTLKNDSLKKRYFYKIISNVLSLIANIGIYTIIPRGLGPRNYGDFNFLTNFFTQFIGFLDMGSSTAFYTKVSQRPRDNLLVLFYLYLTVTVFLIVFCFIGFSYFTSIYTKIWPDQILLYIYLAALFSFFSWSVQILSQLMDAYGCTVSAEKVKMGLKFFAFIAIIYLFLSKNLNLTNFFYYNYLILFLQALGFVLVLKKYNHSIIQAWNMTLMKLKEYLTEFYKYCRPLFFLSLIALITCFLDRWLLQVFGGSIQQGFYSLSYQIGTICFIFTGAMAPLLLRELSIAFEQNDLPSMSRLFLKYSPSLFSLAAFFSCFVAFQGKNVIYLFGGKDFSNALLPIIIMSFYPIHQTYGQLNSSLYYASGQTYLYSLIGIAFSLIGVLAAYFLIAPKSLLGCDAGATGLAIKMVLLNFLGVNTQLFFSSRLLKFSFRKLFVHQFICIGAMIIVAALATFCINELLRTQGMFLLKFIFSGILYTIINAFIFFYVPYIFGLEKQDVTKILCSSRKVFSKNA
ncbi:MAG: lipopolysaccharide biosynthesis protein [Vulcanimicrobiota bacterium]